MRVIISIRWEGNEKTLRNDKRFYRSMSGYWIGVTSMEMFLNQINHPTIVERNRMYNVWKNTLFLQNLSAG